MPFNVSKVKLSNFLVPQEDIFTPIKTNPTGLDSDPLGPATPDIATAKVLEVACVHKPINICSTVS